MLNPVARSASITEVDGSCFEDATAGGSRKGINPIITWSIAMKFCQQPDFWKDQNAFKEPKKVHSGI